MKSRLLAEGGKDAVLIRRSFVAQGESVGSVTMIDVRPEGPEFQGEVTVHYDDCGWRPEACDSWSRSVWIDELGRLAVGDDRSDSIEPAEISSDPRGWQYLMVLKCPRNVVLLSTAWLSLLAGRYAGGTY